MSRDVFIRLTADSIAGREASTHDTAHDSCFKRVLSLLADAPVVTATPNQFRLLTEKS